MMGPDTYRMATWRMALHGASRQSMVQQIRLQQCLHAGGGQHSDGPEAGEDDGHGSEAAQPADGRDLEVPAHAAHGCRQ